LEVDYPLCSAQIGVLCWHRRWLGNAALNFQIAY
jgi:hypothetical protein